jgi:feruloyl esterase
MKHRAGLVGAAAFAVSLFLSAQAHAAARSPAPCELKAFTGLRLRDTSVTSAEAVTGGVLAPPGARASLTGLPAFCRIRGVATPTADSQINFELWIPAGEKWNGKLVATGNGGYSPAMSLPEMAAALRQGYAVVGGDTGHTGDDMLFGVGHPEKIVDWGTRSIHAISVSAKQLIARQRGAAPSRSYYIGCSTGGHQGYAEVQRYPADFDGVIAGDPGANRVALNVEFLWRFLANHPTGDNQQPILDRTAVALLNRRAVEACDKLDGVEDKVIGDPRTCTAEQFDPAALRCRDGQASDCLTPAQLEAVRKIYAGPRNPRTGAQIYPGLAVGSEAGWATYWGTTEPTRADFWRDWVSTTRTGTGGRSTSTATSPTPGPRSARRSTRPIPTSALSRRAAAS